jgi:two-component system, OmpR family, response regulator
VNLVTADRLLSERTRASLAGGPFTLRASVEPLPPGDAELWIVPAADAGGAVAAARGIPVIAHGPAAGLRAAFLAGCVDYLREPWTPGELAVRAAAALERAAALGPGIGAEAGGVRLEGTRLTGPRGTVELTGHQAAVLRLLAARRGAAVGRAALAWAVAGRPPGRGSRSVDVQVAALRTALAAVSPPGEGPRITAVRGRGYLLG